LIAAHAFLYVPLPSGEGSQNQSRSTVGVVSALGSPASSRAGEGSATPMIARLRAAIAAAWPYALELAGYLALRLWVLGFISRPYPFNPKALTALEVVLTIPSAIATYLMLFAMPWRAGSAHRLNVADSITSPVFYVPTLGLAVLCVVAFVALRRNPRRRLYLFCALWVPIVLAPMLNLGGFSIQELIQDRYFFLPSFGLCVLAADLAVSFARGSEARAKVVLAASAAVAICYAAMFISAERYWHDDAAMFSRAAEEVPNNPYWHNELGLALAQRSDFADARRHFETSLKLDPGNSVALYDLSRVYEGLGDPRAAARTLADWLRQGTHPPAGGYAKLALLEDEAGNQAAAEEALGHAEAIPGGSEAAALAHAQIMLRHGDFGSAENAARGLLRLAPNNEQALEVLGMALSAQQRYEDALTAFRHAVALAPVQTPLLHYRIAAVLHQMGREREAHDECAIALADAPNNRSVQALMAEIERSGGAH
jgi:tetratricopeptide (TPR) repeat protein